MNKSRMERPWVSMPELVAAMQLQSGLNPKPMSDRAPLPIIRPMITVRHTRMLNITRCNLDGPWEISHN